MKKFKQYLPDGLSAEIHDNVATFEVQPSDILRVVHELSAEKKLTFKLLDATDERAENGCFKIWYVFGVPGANLFVTPYIRIAKTEEFPSINSVVHAAGQYERKVKDFFGLTPVGNPDQRRLILHENWPEGHYPMRKDFKFDTRPKTATGTYQFQFVDGEGIYEIPVGPIHAGIIEPGHFRFSVAGESIMLLEARLGFVHKGHEKLFEKLELNDALRLSEKISGDSSFSHSLAFCQAVEQLAGITVPKRALYLRTMYAELERLANHIGDIGFIMLDTGFNFGGANGQRMREIVMRINQRLTGSRFLRGVNTFGGVNKDITDDQKEALANELAALLKDFKEVIDIADDSASLQNRLKTTGTLAFGIARDYGAVGVPARAVGIPTDARSEYPYAAYGMLTPRPIASEVTGDVNARFRIRIQEVYASIGIVREVLDKMPQGYIAAPHHDKIALNKNAVAVGCVEGWRGEIVHFIATDKNGKISRVIIRDPSFINWQLVGFCGQNQIVPDFPLINKSFNLSYTGNDL
ncbi:MAG TPA: NADH-quinone oxidoreductase subunit C [Patescibacteria group bacterium]|nr:NADH-quinone oxidoreductase subunit C [Patescibacteria group bacterium]